MWNNYKKGLVVSGFAAMALLVVALWLPSWNSGKSVTTNSIVSVPRGQVELRGGRLCLKSGGGPFTGVMFEHGSDGKKLSEVPVRNGLVHGIARGWHENTVLEIEETFEDGVSHGVRTRWYPNGKKRNTATIDHGVLHGPYTEWHDNGQLAVKMELVKGKAEGLCESWDLDGRLKSRVVMADGKPVRTELIADRSAPEPTEAH